MLIHHDPPTKPVDFLILGAGWTSNFLIPLLQREGITYAATSTTGRDDTIPFKFDPDAPEDATPFKALPRATTIMITFPLKGPGPSKTLVDLYNSTHSSSSSSSSTGEQKPPPSPPNFIQLGVTSIWTAPHFQDHNSPYDTTMPRAQAEDELLSHAPSAAVLSLAGLYGGSRQPRNWVDRVIKDKEGLRVKGALHVIHGEDVARAVVALHRKFTPGKRWLLCDMHVYDWWDLVQDWALLELREASGAEPERIARQEEMLGWVGELMVEENVRALPRDKSQVGRALDGRGFWREMGIWPTQGRIR